MYTRGGEEKPFFAGPLRRKKRESEETAEADFLRAMGAALREAAVERARQKLVVQFPAAQLDKFIGPGGAGINAIRKQVGAGAPVRVHRPDGAANATVSFGGDLEEQQLARELVLTRVANLEKGERGT